MKASGAIRLEAENTDKHEELLQFAKRVFGSKRAMGAMCVQAWATSKGARITMPGYLLEELGISGGDRVAVAEMPNGNFVLAKTNGGVKLTRVAGGESYQASFSSFRLSDDQKPAVAKIEEGLAVWPPKTFEAKE